MNTPDSPGDRGRPGPLPVRGRPQMALITPPPPQTRVLQPVPSSGPMRTPVRPPGRSSLRRTDAGPARLEPVHTPVPSPVPSGRTTSRLQNTNQFSNSLTNSATRNRSGTSAGGSDAVSLSLPRPETDRIVNEYVETPLRGAPGPAEPAPHRTTRTPHSVTNGVSASPRDANFAMVTLPQQAVQTQHDRPHAAEKVVTVQPSATFKKDRSGTGADKRPPDIICSECRRCRCESCRTPRPLPSAWLCGTKCHCSPDAILDQATCLCCAKAVFYHCSSEESADCAESPCSCLPHRRLARWSCLGVMSLILPCLLCYWPCRGLLTVCQRCHETCSRKGCRCRRPLTSLSPLSPLSSEKHLLDSSPE